MTDLATPEFLRQLQSIYPAPAATTPDELLSQPWYIVAAVGFSASNNAAAVPAIWEFQLNELTRLQTEKREDPAKIHEQRFLLASKLKDALLQSHTMAGLPRTIESLSALHRVLPEDLHSKSMVRTIKTMDVYGADGERKFAELYGDKSEAVGGLLKSIYPDLEMMVKTVGYGIVADGDVLSRLEISCTLVAALIAIDAPRQIGWHLTNARNAGASKESAKAIREIAIRVAERAGVKWKEAVPDPEM